MVLVLVFGRPKILPRLAQGAQNFIPVAFNREVERELAPFTKSMHCFVVCPRNTVNAEPHIVLEPVDYETFDKALMDMGKDRDEVSRLATASGRSLTVLRRRLSDMPAMRTPIWAVNHEIASNLVAFAFVGAWSSSNETDQLALSLLAGDRCCGELERNCQRFAQLDDAPVWSIGTYRGVVSKIDLLYAITKAITEVDLGRYFSLARMVLGEDDPTLDLVEEERWAAALHGKTRKFSGAFRKGFSETLVLLAVHGNDLFRSRLSIDVSYEAACVVRDLLLPLTTRKLEANDRDLPTYAEAAPHDFLSIIEQDLSTEQPAVLGLLRPANSAIFGSPSRTGLLWALEGLSWNPNTLLRAALVLARLAEVEITDNWINKPVNSLQSIFRAWMPQTAASHAVRVNVIKILAERFPKVAWKICVAQFGEYHQLGHDSHKPEWRSDGYGFGEPISTWGPAIEFQREMVELALSWTDHSIGMLCDLVERLHGLGDAEQVRVWNLVESWANQKATDADKAILREEVRVKVLSRSVARRSKAKIRLAILTAAARKAYAALEPAGLLERHGWLFRDGWVENSADEIHGYKELDFDARDRRIAGLRAQALREILEQLGYEGVFKLAERGNGATQIGLLLSSQILPDDALSPFLNVAIEPITGGKADTWARKNLITGFLQSIEDDQKREKIISCSAEGFSGGEKVQVLLLAPFRRSTWHLVDALSEGSQADYWSRVIPNWVHDSDSENGEAIERLLKAERPRAAFSCARVHPENLDVHILFLLLSDAAKGEKEQPGEYRLDQYYVARAFKRIDESTDLTLEQKAGLEFTYIEALASPSSGPNSRGVPNLEAYIEAHPELFVHAVVWTYKRKDGALDPPELRVPTESVKHMADKGYKLLDCLKCIPGHNAFGELETGRLANWVKSVRDACMQLGRGEVADSCIGKLLSSAPAAPDGVWPCQPVRQVMEDVRSERMMAGAHTGLFNARGVHFRAAGGSQERALADKYRNWAEALRFTHPYVSSELLMGMVRTYEHQAKREDTEAGIRRRLP